MSSAVGRRRRLSLTLVILLMTSALQIWVCSDYKVQAIRVFPGDVWQREQESFTVQMNQMKNEDLFNKYFSGRRAVDVNQTQNVYGESKRKVPSCPDPLHN